MVRIKVSSGPAVSFHVEQGRPVYVNGEAYTGAYTVTPDVADQVLPTAGKLLRENVAVEKIPLYLVRNRQDGITAYIGGEKYAD